MLTIPFVICLQTSSTHELKVALIDSTGRHLRKHPLSYPFTGEETYAQIVELCKNMFDVASVTALRVGLHSSPEVKSFDGKTLRSYMSAKRIFMSKTRLYVVGSDHSANVQSDDDSDTQQEAHAERPSKKIRKEEQTSATSTEKKQNVVRSIPPQELALGEFIGEGGEARVVKGVWQGMDVAIKVCTIPNRNRVKAIEAILKREVAVHSGLDHKNILLLHGISRDRKGLSIVMELMDGSLYKHVFPAEGDCTMTQQSKLHVAKELLHGMIYLHDQFIVHGDMKPENVLVSDDCRTVKICDLGLCRVKTSIRQTKTKSAVPGTVMYYAPETALHNVKSSIRTDIWAVCGTLCEMFTASELWDIPDDEEDAATYIGTQMSAKKKPNALLVLQRAEPPLARILAKGLSYKPESRPTASQLLLDIEKYE